MTNAGRFVAYDPNAVKPGWIAFFLVMILLVATFLLWRNMNKQMGKIKVPPASAFKDEGRSVDRGTSGPDQPGLDQPGGGPPNQAEGDEGEPPAPR